jgi:GNAT superfamily N-acetyltransferase
MIDFSAIQLVPASENAYEFSYLVKNEAEGEYITQLWGWEETIQRDFFHREWSQIPRDVIEYQGKPIGTLSITEDETGILIRQFFIMPDFENKGIGSFLLKNILDKADRESKTVRLKFLTNNPVKSLYLRHGFSITGQEEYFYSAERQPSDISLSIDKK